MPQAPAPLGAPSRLRARGHGRRGGAGERPRRRRDTPDAALQRDISAVSRGDGHRDGRGRRGHGGDPPGARDTARRRGGGRNRAGGGRGGGAGFTENRPVSPHYRNSGESAAAAAPTRALRRPPRRRPRRARRSGRRRSSAWSPRTCARGRGSTRRPPSAAGRPHRAARPGEPPRRRRAPPRGRRRPRRLPPSYRSRPSRHGRRAPPPRRRPVASPPLRGAPEHGARAPEREHASAPAPGPRAPATFDGPQPGASAGTALAAAASLLLGGLWAALLPRPLHRGPPAAAPEVRARRAAPSAVAPGRPARATGLSASERPSPSTPGRCGPVVPLDIKQRKAASETTSRCAGRCR